MKNNELDEYPENQLPAFSQLRPQEQAVIENLLSGSGTKTAAFLGVYKKTESATSATVRAQIFFARPEVQLALAELQAVRRAEYASMREQLIESWTLDAFFDPKDAYDTAGNLLAPHEMPAHVRQRIKSWKNTRYGVQVEFIDRQRAKTELAALLGIGSSGGQGMTVNINLANQKTQSEEKQGFTLDLSAE